MAADLTPEQRAERRREVARARTRRQRVSAALALTLVAGAGAAAVTAGSSGGSNVRSAPATAATGARTAARPRRMTPVGASGTSSTAQVRRPAPVIAQKLHNDCEATALQILLATEGIDVGQLQLQSEFPRNGPLDPRNSAGGLVWGDPELGFVGRPDGGGTAGGYGIYPRPVAATAGRHGATLIDISGSAVRRLYARVRARHAVMAWIALSNGSYGVWRSPAGRIVRVNFGEHTVVVTRVDAAGVHLVNPLQGTREVWTRALFEQRWGALGRRALST